MPSSNHKAYRHGLLPESNEYRCVLFEITYSVLLYTVLNAFCVNVIPQVYIFIHNFFKAENVGIVFIMPAGSANLPSTGAPQWDLRVGKIFLVILTIGMMLLQTFFQQYQNVCRSSLPKTQILHGFDVVINETPCAFEEVDANAEDAETAGFVVVDVSSRF